MELEEIVITQAVDSSVPILIGRDPIGIDLKNLLEPKFLKHLSLGRAVEHMLEATSAKEHILKLSEKLLMQKFVSVKQAIMEVAKLLKIAIVKLLSRFLIVDLTFSMSFPTSTMADLEHIVQFESKF